MYDQYLGKTGTRLAKSLFKFVAVRILSTWLLARVRWAHLTLREGATQKAPRHHLPGCQIPNLPLHPLISRRKTEGGNKGEEKIRKNIASSSSVRLLDPCEEFAPESFDPSGATRRSAGRSRSLRGLGQPGVSIWSPPS
jgi:hypothetical protein